jgi:hypothetical protein
MEERRHVSSEVVAATADSVRAPPIAAPFTLHVAPGFGAMSVMGSPCSSHVVYSLIESNP